MVNDPITQQNVFATRQFHAGQRPDPTTGSIIVPVYQTISYAFENPDHEARQSILQAQLTAS